MAISIAATEPSTPLILLAEDSEDDAFFFDRALKKASVGCLLKRALNGKAAIEILRGDESGPRLFPILIFLDLKMPVLSGFEVLEWLKSAQLDPKPTVIVLSGSNDQADRGRAMNLGAADYLVKPIRPEDIRERVLAALKTRDSLFSEAGACP